MYFTTIEISSLFFTKFVKLDPDPHGYEFILPPGSGAGSAFVLLSKKTLNSCRFAFFSRKQFVCKDLAANLAGYPAFLFNIRISGFLIPGAFLVIGPKSLTKSNTKSKLERAASAPGKKARHRAATLMLEKDL